MNVALRTRKVVRLVVTFAVFLVAMAVLHELWHHLAATAVGASIESPQITMYGFWAGTYIPDWGDITTEWQWSFIAFAGGIGTALTFGVLWLFARLSPSGWDMNIEFSAGTLAGLQLGAGLAEGTAHNEPNYQTIALFFMLVGFGAMILYESYRWANWFINDKAS